MIDKDKIIKDIKKVKKFKPQFLLRDGGVVVDTVVDELNRLNYVIKKGNDFTVELAEKSKPIQVLVERKPIKVTINNGVATVED